MGNLLLRRASLVVVSLATGLPACGSHDGSPSQSTTVASAAPSTPAPSTHPLFTFEGSVDVTNRTMAVTWTSPAGRILAQDNLPYGNAPGDVYFHTCSVDAYGTDGAHVLSGSVQAVNRMATSIDGLQAIIDTTTPSTVTPLGAIATYATITDPNSADCSSTVTWEFTDPTDTNFHFTGHAEGIACTSCSELPTSAECIACNCTFSNGVCGPTAPVVPCSTLTDEASCAQESVCIWVSAMPVCTATTTCTTFGTPSDCQSGGCTWSNGACGD